MGVCIILNICILYQSINICLHWRTYVCIILNICICIISVSFEAKKKFSLRFASKRNNLIEANRKRQELHLYLELVSVDGACGSTLLAYAAYAVANC
jgi:hypothetical protein